jgi:deoxyribose-phosphate aldolase
MMSIATPQLSAARPFEDPLAATFDTDAFAKAVLSTTESLAAVCELVLVSPDLSAEDVTAACESAAPYPLACVTVNPFWIGLAHSVLSGTGICVGAVAGSPGGATLTHNKRDETDSAVRLGAREVTTSIQLGALKGRDFAVVRSDLAAVVDVAHGAGALVTATIEAHRLTIEEKLRAAEICLAAEVDFLAPESTRGGCGDSLDISLFRGVAGAKCGIKTYQPVSTRTEADQRLRAGASRLGGARILDLLIGYEGGSARQPR